MKEECKEKTCRNSKCQFRHRRVCKYFEKFGRCKFGDFCEYRHRKPEHIEAIEKRYYVLEKALGENKEDFQIFTDFFRKDILERQIKIQTDFVEDTMC